MKSKISNSASAGGTPHLPSAWWPGRWGWLALAATVLLIIVVRVRLLDLPLERDEGEYAYAGQLMLQGIPPYKLAYNMKLPGTYASYAGIMAVFGQTIAGIHLGFLIVSLATMVLLFFIARRWLDVPRAVIACVCYGLFSMSPGVLGLEGHATHLVMLAALGGTLLLQKARESGNRWTLFASGLAFGWSFVCKQPGLFFAMFGSAILAGDLYRAWRRKAGLGPGLLRLICFCAGVALPFLLTCVWLLWAGTFDRFWFWTVEYANVHAHLLTWRQGLKDLAAFKQKSGAMQWSWLAAMIGLFCLARDPKRAESRAVIGGLLVFSLMSFTASFYFSRHYFIMMLPVVCLLIAIAVRAAAEKFGELVPSSVFALACVGFIFVNRAIWFGQTPEGASRALYGGNPFPEAITIAKYIEEHSKPGDSIAIMGSEPEICFYAHRHSATGYIYMYDLMQRHRYAAPMQKEAIAQIKAAKPAFMLLVYVNASWMFSPDSDLGIMDWLKVYWGQYYTLAGTAWMLPDRTEYVWGKDSLKAKFDTSLRVAILERKKGV